MKKIRVLVVLIQLLATSALAEWYALPSTVTGQPLRFDPNTGRVQTQINNSRRPMWDGVHRLENGQVLHIQNGQIVRDKTLKQWQEKSRSYQQTAVCRALVKRSCGYGQCADSPSCKRAHQLLSAQDEAVGQQKYRINQHCHFAMKDLELFTPCVNRNGAIKKHCWNLMIKSCGLQMQCADTESCQMASQLGRIAEDEQRTLSPQTPWAEPQCKHMLDNEGLFPPCK